MSSDAKTINIISALFHFYTSLSHAPFFSSCHSWTSFYISAHQRSPFPSCSPLDIFNYEIPSINVNLDSLIDEFSGAPRRRSLAVTDSPEGDAVPEEEPQSTILWPMTLRYHLPATPVAKHALNCRRQGLTEPPTGLINAHLKPEYVPSDKSATDC